MDLLNRAFSLKVTHRCNVEFQVDESEAVLSSRFIDMDENYFTPTIVTHSQESVSPHITFWIISEFISVY
jgi:autophagy-related protein 13